MADFTDGGGVGGGLDGGGCDGEGDEWAATSGSSRVLGALRAARKMADKELQTVQMRANKVLQDVGRGSLSTQSVIGNGGGSWGRGLSSLGGGMSNAGGSSSNSGPGRMQGTVAVLRKRVEGAAERWQGAAMGSLLDWENKLRREEMTEQKREKRKRRSRQRSPRSSEFLERVPFMSSSFVPSTIAIPGMQMPKSKSDSDLLALEKYTKQLEKIQKLKEATAQAALGSMKTPTLPPPSTRVGVTDQRMVPGVSNKEKHEEWDWDTLKKKVSGIVLWDGSTQQGKMPHNANALGANKVDDMFGNFVEQLERKTKTGDGGPKRRKPLTMRSNERDAQNESSSSSSEESNQDLTTQLRRVRKAIRNAGVRVLSLTPEAERLIDMNNVFGEVVTAPPAGSSGGAETQNGSSRRRYWRSIRDEGRHIAIITTASLPWMTGTAVNPLLRAAYLAAEDKKITLVVPWIPHVDQQKIFPHGKTFSSPEEQEAFVRSWLRDRVGFEPKLKMRFYPGRYAAEKCSIIPIGDITKCVPDIEADVAVLEEPEHLSWYHHGTRWTDKFAHVVGIVHTNYLEYARREEGGEVKSAFLKRINQWVCRIYCDKVVKLSDAVQPLPRQTTLWVHGVSPKFLEVGKRVRLDSLRGHGKNDAEADTPPPTGPDPKGRDVALTNGDSSASNAAPLEEKSKSSFKRGCYFIGKAVWGKGYTELLELMAFHQREGAGGVDLDIYGSGDDIDAIQERARAGNLPVQFHGARDHADSSIHDYKVFLNPSLSDVVATTTAEALAMGKFVVVADHPSNEFFKQFRNCLIYTTPQEFSARIDFAMREEPAPLTEKELFTLSWEAATERFLDVAEMDKKAKAPLASAVDGFLARAHKTMTGSEAARVVLGGGAHSKETPECVTDLDGRGIFDGGFFDRGSRMFK